MKYERELALICVGVTMGIVFAQLLTTIQPKIINHNVSLTIDKPIEARLAIEAVDNCTVSGECQ